jgi:hypothetical protein
MTCLNSQRNQATVFESRRLQWPLPSGGARWRLFWLATQAPGQIAGRHVGNHGKQHEEHGDPKNPTVVHSLPARAMGMIAVVLMIVLCFIHRLLRSTSTFRGAACLCRFIGELTFYPANCENRRKLGRAGKLPIVEYGILRKSEVGDWESVDEWQQSPPGALLIGAILFAEFAHEKIFLGMDACNDGHEHRDR